jgi:hypothetical protein
MKTDFTALLRTRSKREAPTVDDLLCEDHDTHVAEREAVDDVREIVRELKDEKDNKLALSA